MGNFSDFLEFSGATHNAVEMKHMSNLADLRIFEHSLSDGVRVKAVVALVHNPTILSDQMHSFI